MHIYIQYSLTITIQLQFFVLDNIRLEKYGLFDGKQNDTIVVIQIHKRLS